MIEVQEAEVFQEIETFALVSGLKHTLSLQVIGAD